MSSDTVLVQTLAERLHNIEFPSQRAAELAIELRQLHDAVRNAAQGLQFDDEPAGFTTFLEGSGN
jgi:hypothetical protein